MKITVRYANDYGAHWFTATVEPDTGSVVLADKQDGSETTSSVDVSPEKLRRWTTDLHKLRVPAIPPGQITCDGEQWTVEFTDGVIATSYTWVSDVPRGWAALDWLARAIAKEAGATW